MHRLHRFIISIIIFIVTVSAFNIQWSGSQWKNIINADGKGYYAYLPAVFIYHDLNFSFFDSVEKKYPNPNTFCDYRVNYNGKTSNKYFAGTALAMSPFFFIAHISSSFFGFESDGYSAIYLILIGIAGIFYLWLGLFYMKKLLLVFTKSETLVSFLLPLIVFSTNLFYYAVCEPSMSHIYSFAFITAFVFYAKNYFESYQTKLILVLSFLLGIIILIRPVNGIIVLILPFIAGDWTTFKTGIARLFKNNALLFISILLFVSIVSIQFIIYKIQTGHFFIDTYGEEKFNWLAPHPFNFLFSYKKGLFVYTPVLFLSFYGLFVLWKENRFRFYSLLLFLIILVYVLSSWWSWWYGGSFGTRVMLEYYSIFVLLLLFAVENLKAKWAKTIFYFSLFLTLIVCQIQTYQFRYYHIHWEKMDKEHYWRVFLRVDLLAKNINLNKDLLEK